VAGRRSGHAPADCGATVVCSDDGRTPRRSAGRTPTPSRFACDLPGPRGPRTWRGRLPAPRRGPGIRGPAAGDAVVRRAHAAPWARCRRRVRDRAAGRRPAGDDGDDRRHPCRSLHPGPGTRRSTRSRRGTTGSASRSCCAR
jgi:hypothetical protein